LDLRSDPVPRWPIRASGFASPDAESGLCLYQPLRVFSVRADFDQASARTQLDDPSFNITRVLGTSPEPFLNLWRHETALSRSLQRTLHELERLQANRAGQHVPVPAIVDVDVSLPDLSFDIGRTDTDGESDGNQRWWEANQPTNLQNKAIFVSLLSDDTVQGGSIASHG
jgi:hypothetical protein